MIEGPQHDFAFGAVRSIDNMEMEMHQCPHCPCEFDWKFQADHHVQREHTHVCGAKLFHAIVEPEQFACIHCAFKSYYIWDLYEHYKQEHHGTMDESDLEQTSFLPEVADKCSCNLCRYKSNSLLCMVKHTNSCKMIAGQSTGDYSGTDNEASASYSSVVIVDGKKTKYFHCTHCSHKTKWKRHLKSHMMKHASSENINWFQCAKCSFKSKWKESLKKHMMTHASNYDINWFQCAKCSYKSKWRKDLNKHMLHHVSSDIDWFRCTECSYKCKWKGALKPHMMTHASSDDIDWFQCTKCSYKCKFKGALKKHMITHAASDDTDWFQCTKCSHKSKFKGALKKHMITHASVDDIDWFQCTNCSYKSKWKFDLKKHIMRLHASSKNIN